MNLFLNKEQLILFKYHRAHYIANKIAQDSKEGEIRKEAYLQNDNISSSDDADINFLPPKETSKLASKLIGLPIASNKTNKKLLKGIIVHTNNHTSEQD